MVKKLFMWENSLLVVPCLLALGAAFWLSASVLDPRIHPYVIAFLFFSTGLAWTLMALWQYDSFKKPRNRYRANRSRPSAQLVTRSRRRRNKEERRIGALGAVTVFAILCSVVFHSYQKAAHPAQAARMEVFVQTDARVRALPVPFGANPDDSTVMTFALQNLPIVDMKVDPATKMVRAYVILRNVGGSAMHGLHVRLDSEVPMNPADANLISISPYQMERYVGTMEMAHNEHDEIKLPIDIPIKNYQTKTGILVTMQTDETLSYAAAAKLNLVRSGDPELTLQSAR